MSKVPKYELRHRTKNSIEKIQNLNNFEKIINWFNETEPIYMKEEKDAFWFTSDPADGYSSVTKTESDRKDQTNDKFYFQIPINGEEGFRFRERITMREGDVTEKGGRVNKTITLTTIFYKKIPILEKTNVKHRKTPLEGIDTLYYYILPEKILTIHVRKEDATPKVFSIQKPEVLNTDFKAARKAALQRSSVYDPFPFHNQIIEKDHPVYGKLRY